jgi:hypothetical protein
MGVEPGDGTQRARDFTTGASLSDSTGEHPLSLRHTSAPNPRGEER